MSLRFPSKYRAHDFNMPVDDAVINEIHFYILSIIYYWHCNDHDGDGNFVYEVHSYYRNQ